MESLAPIFDHDSFALYQGSAADVLTGMAAGLGSIGLMLTPVQALDTREIDRIVGELLRVVAGPVIVVAPIYGSDWATAFQRHNAEIKIASYFNTFDIVAANADRIQLPEDPDTLCGLLESIVEQAGSGNVIDPFARSWLTALPVIKQGLRFIGIVGANAEYPAAFVRQSIERKLAGRERCQNFRQGVGA